MTDTARDWSAAAAKGRMEPPGTAPDQGAAHTAPAAPPAAPPASIDAMAEALARVGYVADRSLTTVTFLSTRLGKPLFLEGEAGVGKTEIALALAETLGRRLIRLQCYEGIDAAAAVYEWNFPAQMLAIRTAEALGPGKESTGNEALGNEGTGHAAIRRELFSEEFLIRRPLLEALDPADGKAPILLIDEIDRADEPFEAFLLEALSAFQVTIPELGTIRAKEPPLVVLTSNRTREVHDALKRRCLYHWVDYPTLERELEILRARVPEASARLSREIVAFAQALRGEDIFKKPGVAETIDWARCLLALDAVTITPELVADTLGALLKYQDDIARIAGAEAARLVETAQEAADMAADGV